MAFNDFVSKILDMFGEEATVRNDRENGLYVARCGEWRISLRPSSRKMRCYNVRNKFNGFVEI